MQNLAEVFPIIETLTGNLNLYTSLLEYFLGGVWTSNFCTEKDKKDLYAFIRSSQWELKSMTIPKISYGDIQKELLSAKENVTKLLNWAWKSLNQDPKKIIKPADFLIKEPNNEKNQAKIWWEQAYFALCRANQESVECLKSRIGELEVESSNYRLKLNLVKRKLGEWTGVLGRFKGS